MRLPTLGVAGQLPASAHPFAHQWFDGVELSGAEKHFDGVSLRLVDQAELTSLARVDPVDDPGDGADGGAPTRFVFRSAVNGGEDDGLVGDCGGDSLDPWGGGELAQCLDGGAALWRPGLGGLAGLVEEGEAGNEGVEDRPLLLGGALMAQVRGTGKSQKN